MSIPRISVITIVFNDAKGLERTIQSIINQTFKDLEFIVIDGGSTDQTPSIIEKYKDKIDCWVSEKDNGIYDAMNKGIKASTGHWLNFMNAGDIFIDNDVLGKVNLTKFQDTAIVYGNKIQNEKVISPIKIDKLELGEIIACHQSMFFNINVLNDELTYDLNFPIYGDYELVNKIYKKGYRIKYINLEIAETEGGGISSLVSTQKRKDKYKAVYKYYGISGVFRAIIYRLSK